MELKPRYKSDYCPGLGGNIIICNGVLSCTNINLKKIYK